MAIPTVIVFEKRARWAPELQRQFVNEGVRVRACRSTADILLYLHESDRSVLVLDLDAGTAVCLQFLGRLLKRTPRVPVIVVGSKATGELEWPIRELGVIDFIREPVSGKDLANLCCRQWSVPNDCLASPQN